MTLRDEVAARVLPYRWYQRGDRCLALAIDRKFPLPAPAVSSDAVLLLADEIGIRCSSCQAADLAELLSIIGATVPIDRAFPEDFRSRYNEFAAAIAVIEQHAPYFEGIAGRRSPAETALADQLIQLRDAAAQSSKSLSQFFPKTGWWHNDAEYMRWVLRGATFVRGRHAGKPVGFSKETSPAVKFISAAFGMAGLKAPDTGRLFTPSASQVARFFKERGPLPL